MNESFHDNPPLMLERVQAGFPSPAEQYVESSLDLNQYLVHNPAATFFVRASGDSMQNAGIRSGDLLVVDRSVQPKDGSVVIAAVDGEFTVKYYSCKNGKICLLPGNDSYPPIELHDGMELQIFGVVTAIVHKC